MIQRYALFTHGMQEAPTCGRWVKYEDYEKAIKEAYESGKEAGRKEMYQPSNTLEIIR